MDLVTILPTHFIPYNSTCKEYFRFLLLQSSHSFTGPCCFVLFLLQIFTKLHLPWLLCITLVTNLHTVQPANVAIYYSSYKYSHSSTCQCCYILLLLQIFTQFNLPMLLYITLVTNIHTFWPEQGAKKVNCWALRIHANGCSFSSKYDIGHKSVLSYLEEEKRHWICKHCSLEIHKLLCLKVRENQTKLLPPDCDYLTVTVMSNIECVSVVGTSKWSKLWFSGKIHIYLNKKRKKKYIFQDKTTI